MRAEPLLGAMNLIGVTPTEGDLGIVGAQRIRVGLEGAERALGARRSRPITRVRMPQAAACPIRSR